MAEASVDTRMRRWWWWRTRNTDLDSMVVMWIVFLLLTDIPAARGELDLCSNTGQITTDNERVVSTNYATPDRYVTTTQCGCTIQYIAGQIDTNNTDPLFYGFRERTTIVNIQLEFLSPNNEEDCSPYVALIPSATVQHYICPKEQQESEGSYSEFTMVVSETNTQVKVIVQNPDSYGYRFQMSVTTQLDDNIWLSCGATTEEVAPVVYVHESSSETPEGKKTSSSKAAVRAAIAVVCVLAFLIALAVITYLIVRRQHKKHIQEKVEEHQRKARENGGGERGETGLHENPAFRENADFTDITEPQTAPTTNSKPSPKRNTRSSGRNGRKSPQQQHPPRQLHVSHHPAPLPQGATMANPSIAGMGLVGPDSEFGSIHSSLAGTPNQSFTAAPYNDFVVENKNTANQTYSEPRRKPPASDSEQHYQNVPPPQEAQQHVEQFFSEV